MAAATRSIRRPASSSDVEAVIHPLHAAGDAKELRPWIPTFPVDYYRQIYRLNGWAFDEQSTAPPGVIGHWTNNIIYKRLAPAVWEELKRLTPRSERGNLKHKLFQRLTDDIGHPKPREHLVGVVMLMKYAPDWQTFMDRLDVEYPQWGTTRLLPFPNGYTPPIAPASASPQLDGQLQLAAPAS